MPRDGSNIYHKPAGTDGVPNFPIESAKYNAYTADVEQDLNLPRPIVAGGTGANNATDALFNVKGEIATQIVTNWDSQVWVPGSFYAASSATGTSPVAGHNFAGQVYIGEALANPPSNQNVILEARDLDNTTPPGALYVRQKKAGVWSAWSIGTVGTLTDAEKTAARQQIYAAPLDALAYNGMQVNGGMEVSQELGSSGIVIPNGGIKYVADCWRCYSNNAATRVINVTQTAGPTNLGLQNTLIVTSTTGGSYAAAGDLVYLYQSIEGYRTARLGWGFASAQSITIGFYAWATIAGTLAVSIQNSASNRSYVADVVINSAATWEYKTVTIPGDTTGTWLTTNGIGINLGISPSGSGSGRATPNTWTAANATVTANTTNFMATNNNVVQITGVVVLPGLEAPSAARSALIMRPFTQELVTCQRYYQKSYPYDMPPGTPNPAGNGFVEYSIGINTSGTVRNSFVFPTAMRALPSIAIYDQAGAVNKLTTADQFSNLVNGQVINLVTSNQNSFMVGIYNLNVAGFHCYYTADARL